MHDPIHIKNPCLLPTLLQNSVGIITNCYSILFLKFMNDLKVSSTMIAVVFNGESFTWSSANLITGPLVDVFGWRKVAFCGGLLTAVGMGASAFATSASFLLVSHALLTGELGTVVSLWREVMRVKRLLCIA